ncbi:hypothetical protein LOTGIDRAFT_176502 [Lottia gigantea]|uniref:Uncharacterized protein n=1 Tax=Lottia gigantea TaxID=225164 RepID=V4APV9_LOTGI|nr:hypothetical protein LOTGIDRAFT_176502 [Lottia gigantea]ESO99247.1 hypothetical protein LOTGIDRAFT_176502 [Lottia gigantea]
MASALVPEIEVLDEGQDPVGTNTVEEIQTGEKNAANIPIASDRNLTNALTTLQEKEKTTSKTNYKAELIANLRTLKESQILRKQQLLLELKREQLALEIELSMCENESAHPQFETTTPHQRRLSSVYDRCFCHWLPIDDRMWSGEVDFIYIENWAEDVDFTEGNIIYNKNFTIGLS